LQVALFQFLAAMSLGTGVADLVCCKCEGELVPGDSGFLICLNCGSKEETNSPVQAFSNLRRMRSQYFDKSAELECGNFPKSHAGTFPEAIDCGESKSAKLACGESKSAKSAELACGESKSAELACESKSAKRKSVVAGDDPADFSDWASWVSRKRGRSLK
jgi:hypothetical protein